MKAFLAQLQRDAKVASKISNLFDIDSTEYFYLDENGNKITKKDSNVVRLSKENLKKGLIQFYLNVLYKLIEESAVNSDVKNALTVRSYDSPIFDSINKVLNSEYLGGFRYFQQSSGNREAINYIYEFSTYLERGYIVDDLKLTEEPPLHLKYNGSLHESLFINFMKKMSHPAGWTSKYENITDLSDLTDYFGISLDVNLSCIMLDCTAKDFPIIWNFYDAEETISFLKTKVNYHTQNKFTDDDFSNVQFIQIEGQPTIKKYIRRDVTAKQYDLSNGMTLYDNGCTYYLNTELFNKINWESQNEIDVFYFLYKNSSTPIYKYLGYRLVPYAIIDTWHFVYYDQQEMELELFPGYTDNSFYFLNDDSNALNITGDEYHFVQGFDEAFNNITNYDSIINSYNKAFNIHIELDTYYLTLFKIYDDFGHGYIKTLSKVNRELQIFDYSLLRLEGSNVYIELFDAENGLTYYYTNINYNDYISNIDYKTINELTVSGYSSSENTLKFTSQSKTLETTVNGDFTYTFNVEECNENEDYILTLGSLTIKSNLIQQESNRPNLKVLYLNDFNKNINTRSFTNKNRQTGILSGDGDTFYNYTLDDPDNFDVAKNTIYEGTPYRTDFKNNGFCTYINYGFKKVSSDSNDCIIPCCTKYMEDEFYINYYNPTGFYLVFDDSIGDENLTAVGRYLYFRNETTYDNLLTEGYILNNFSFTNKNNYNETPKINDLVALEETYYLTFRND